MSAFHNLHCFEKYNMFVWAKTSNIKIKAILVPSRLWGSLVELYPIVALSSSTELHVCCVGPLRLCYINNPFKSNIKIKADCSVSSVFGVHWLNCIKHFNWQLFTITGKGIPGPGNSQIAKASRGFTSYRGGVLTALPITSSSKVASFATLKMLQSALN